MSWYNSICISLLAAGLSFGVHAQSPPPNPHLAESPWPIYHANTYGTASSQVHGPGDVSMAQSIDSLTKKGFGRKNARRNKPKVSPWTVMAKPYRTGAQAVFTTPNDGIAKYIITDDRLEAVDFLKLDRRTLDFDWGILLRRDGTGIVTEKKRDRFVVFGDARLGEPRSPIKVMDYIPVSRKKYGKLTAHFTLGPDGTLIALTELSKLIAINIDRRTVITDFDLPSGSGISFHNSFPIDETGRMYLSTQTMMAAVDWDGRAFRLVWTAAYDMRGPGCEDIKENKSRRSEILAVVRGKRCTGSGTTPTLIGDHKTGVVVIVDGHAPRNNLVAFWRGQPPQNWRALPDPTGRVRSLDRRIAGVLALPHSTPDGRGFTAENSPAALGNSVVVAQWAGLKPGKDAPRGVQRVDWISSERRFDLIWANSDTHFNGVPTIGCQQGRRCRVYGMGRYDQGYQYRSIDLETGRVSGKVILGDDKRLLDQGNNHAIASDGSIVYGGSHAMVRVK